MTIDERIEALTMNLELMSRDREDDHRRIQAILTAVERDGENIRALARIAQLRHERLTHFEGGPA